MQGTSLYYSTLKNLFPTLSKMIVENKKLKPKDIAIKISEQLFNDPCSEHCIICYSFLESFVWKIFFFYYLHH